MTGHGKYEPKICAFCGTNQATTRDHVPPKGIFTRPLPNDLVTVPACNPCNNKASVLDEQFRVMLSLRVGVDTPETLSLWKDKTLRGLHHNAKLRTEIIEGMEQVLLESPGGVIVGKATITKWDAASHDETICRITRGLLRFSSSERVPRLASPLQYQI